MSLRALSWAYAVDDVDDPPARHVLQCLAWHANAENLAWPAAGTIARETGYHRATVIRHLEQLEQLLVIERTGRLRGRRIEYRVKVRDVDLEADRNVAERDTTPAPARLFGDLRTVAERDTILSQSATQTKREPTTHDVAAGLEAEEVYDSSRSYGLGAARDAGERRAI